MKKQLLILLLLAFTASLPAAPVDPSTFAQPVRVACVGDSITYGVGTTRGNSYPSQLGRMLGDKWVVMNFGVSGATLLNHGDRPYQKQWKFKKALASKPDVVVIKLGTNDSKPQNWKFHDEFAADYENLVSQFAKLPSHPRIFVCYPAFVPGPGNYGINEPCVLQELPIVDQIATTDKLDRIDLQAPLKDHPDWLPDRIHPNNAGATAMAKTVYLALTGKEFTGEAPLVTVVPPAN